LRSVSSRRLPGRTFPSGRWLGVSREASLAAARSLVALLRACPAAGSTVALPPLPGWRARIPGASMASGGAVVVWGVGFGGVGDRPGRVVGLVGVAVQCVEGEVFAGVFEVVLLAPAGSHPVGDLGGGQVG